MAEGDIRSTRYSVEIGTAQETLAAEGPMRITRYSGEVLSKVIQSVLATRYSAEVGLIQTGADPGFPLAVTRYSGEVLSKNPKFIEATRYSMELAELQGALNTGYPLAVTRYSGEVLSATRTIFKINPDPNAEFLEFFVHNWSSKGLIESLWKTDIQIAVDTSKEERTSLTQRPIRNVTYNFNEVEKERVQDLLYFIQRASIKKLILPLHMDEIAVTETQTIATRIPCDPTLKRLFVGGRILIVNIDLDGWPIEEELAFIKQIGPGYIDVVDPITLTLTPGVSFVYPCIDVDPSLEIQSTPLNDRLHTVQITALEAFGEGSLGAIASELPAGFPSYQEKPILNIEPNWVESVTRGVSREGQRREVGRATLTTLTGPRGRHTVDYIFTLDRADGWDILSFLDSRRGRTRSFFSIEPDDLWTIVNLIDIAGQIDIEPLGDFDRFFEMFLYDPLDPTSDLGWVGIVKENSDDYIVREVASVEDFTTYWRITTTEALPTITIPEIRRIARARLMRLKSDSYKESWESTNVIRIAWNAIETLEDFGTTTPFEVP